MGKKIVIALGGNAILQPKQEATFDNQYGNVMNAANRMVEIKEAGHKIVITHGNGPQVGNIIAQHEAAKAEVPAMPIFVNNAESQGMIGYMMEAALKNRLAKSSDSTNVVTLLTMVEVDKNDKAFDNPTKPVGAFFTEEEATRLNTEKGYQMIEDAGRGFRRVVPSPQPKNIHGVTEIKTLMETSIVVSSGGGGIPIYRDDAGQIHGVEAVIDKDRSGLKLSEQIEADIFMMLTDVPNVYINYGKENEQKLEEISVAEAELHVANGEFAAGSMLPKIESAIAFAKHEGKVGIICSLDEAMLALEGKAGTRIKL